MRQFLKGRTPCLKNFLSEAYITAVVKSASGKRGSLPFSLPVLHGPIHTSPESWRVDFTDWEMLAIEFAGLASANPQGSKD
jgi:hypothetical protein